MPSIPLIGLVDHIAPPAQDKSEPHSTMLGRPSKFARQRIQKARLSIPEDEMSARSLNQIKGILSLDFEATELGSLLSSEAGTLSEQSNVLQVLSDAFATKATGTIVRRVSSFWRFAKWMISDRNWNSSCLEANEEDTHLYVCSLRDSSAGPTSATHFIESFRFFDSVVKFRKLSISKNLSSRVVGAARSMHVQKRKLKQIDQLTVKAVCILEDTCLRSTSELEILMSGALLLCIFSCARWSDCARLERCRVDQHKSLVLVEAESSKHKTSKTKEAQSRMLPFTALGKFMSKDSWATKFVETREKLGLPEGAQATTTGVVHGRRTL